MPSNYQYGARKEQMLVEDLRNEGFDIVQRTAGSHSEVDIIAIDSTNKIIKLVQSKRDMGHDMHYIRPELKEKLEKKYSYLSGTYTVEFVAL